MKRASILLAFVAQLLLLPQAQAFPDRPIKLVVPSPAGSPPDEMARIISDKMAQNLGQPIIVENRTPGAGGTIGVRSVMSAEPDGYTILLSSTSNLLIAPQIYKNAGYNAGSFAPVARISDTMEMLAVHPSVPAHSVAELVALAKAKPGTLNFGSAGVGTLPHIEGELLKVRAGIDISHVPYRGGNQALTGLIAGEIQMLFSTLVQVLPQVRDGRARGLAVAGDVRSPLAPELPTMVECGFDGFVMTSITGIVAPPATPLAIRQQINKAVAFALASDQVKRAFARLGANARQATPEEFGAYLASEQKRWGGIVATTKVSMD